MTNNSGKQIRLDEGRVQRGNSGQGPRTPKPEITPKGQASVQQQRACDASAAVIRLTSAVKENNPFPS